MYLMAKIICSEEQKTKGQELLDEANKHISKYDIPNYEISSLVFFDYGLGAHNRKIIDNIVVFDDPQKADDLVTVLKIAHESVHLGIREEILGSLDSEIVETLDRIRDSRDRRKERLENPYNESFTDEGRTAKYNELSEKPYSSNLLQLTLPGNYPGLLHPTSDNEVSQFEERIENMLIDDVILSVIDRFEEEYSAYITNEELNELSEKYQVYLEKEKSNVEEMKEELIDPFRSRFKAAKEIAHPAEEAMVTLFEAKLPCPQSYLSHLEDSISEIEGMEIEDLDLDNDVYVDARIDEARRNYDEDPKFTIYDDHETTVSGWMREFHNLYQNKRSLGRDKKESFNEVFDYGLNQVIIPYAEKKLENLEY